MKIIRSISDIPKFRNPVVATGLFDGVHNGHKAVISGIKKIAQVNGSETVIVSFDPHPAVVLHPDKCSEYKFLNTTEEKIKLLEQTGVDFLILINFTREFAALSAEEYIRDYIVEKLGAKTVMAGYNHHFGKAGEGDNSVLYSLATKYNFEVAEIDAKLQENELVTNSVISNSLVDGNIMRVNAFLGYNYHISGNLTSIPEENDDYSVCKFSDIDCRKMLPTSGRYAARLECNDKSYNCLAEVTKISGIENLKILGPKTDLCYCNNKAILYFYKKLRSLDANDDGYFFRARSVDQTKLDELLF